MQPMSHWVDLASERLGGRAVLANDEFFAPKENLLKPGRGTFIEGKYTDRGKWMDGWETRRRRTPGYDWCVIRLGLPGRIRTVTVDTNHFRGNHPESCSIEACAIDVDPGAEADKERSGKADWCGTPTEPDDDAEVPADAGAGAPWVELVPRNILTGHAENHFTVTDGGRYTYVRLNIFPDGGVARLRVLGEVMPDWAALAEGTAPRDLIAIEHGGVPLACSDQFFSEPVNLLMPGRAGSMADGWETRRRRGPGHDWAVIRLGHPGVVEHVVVDTNHFKGNYPESCALEGCLVTGPPGGIVDDKTDWFPLLPRTPLEAHREHAFPIAEGRPVSHVRLNIYPDGGVSRLRVFGRPAGGR